MPLVIERRRTRAALWSRRVGSFAIVLFAVATLGHRLGLLETVAFLAVLGLVALLALAALALAFRAFLRIWVHADRGGGDMAIGVACALLVLSPFLLAGFRAATLPMLYDITTDPESAPAFDAATSERTRAMVPIRPWTAAMGRAQAAAYPEVTGRRYVAPPELVEAAVDAVVKRNGWQMRRAWLAAPDGSEATIEAVAWTPIFALPVDVAIRVSDEGGSAYVDMRSVSRYGRHDLGDNADRITSFMSELDAEVESRPAGPTPRPEAVPSPG